ncbi:SpaH/EbpB family LPXTG-anchored major pilin [uncultured Dubosiella sp.]|uniref:SpaH/EbpB family LPXTG-anchored major pilin n=2 Tax=uncultured Dubosiella sp. TaxID=1937011 RepID=UPI0025D250A0|nr:SpaH/EbpB family LPXTG-anchored major pilin [uncultured Dubosiella sp.]
MKSLKKILSIFAAFMMVVGLTMTNASAEEPTKGTITIAPANENQTYSIYRIFEEKYNSATGATAYTLTNSWAGLKNDETFKKFFKVEGTDIIPIGNYVSEDKNTKDAAAKEFAKAAEAYATKNNIIADKTVISTNLGENVEYTAPVKNTDENGDFTITTPAKFVISNMPFGYYLVTSTTGSLVSLAPTAPSQTIEDKNNIPEFKKEKVEDTKGTYGVGDTISYKITVGQSESATNVVVTDTMSKGLTFNNDLKVNNQDIGTAYTLVTSKNDDGETVLTLTFNKNGLNNLKTQSAVITYSATVNDSAVTNLNNKAVLTFGNNPNAATDTEVTKKTVDINIYKYGLKTDESKQGLEDATFTLKRVVGNSETVLTFTGEKGVYTKAADTEDGTPIISKTGGTITLKGLAEGTYILEETVAPSGYNKLTKTVKFMVGANGAITLDATADNATEASVNTNDNTQLDVLNTKGAQLPSTGGMGTTMIYIAGAILMVGAAIIFVTNKRMKHE